MTPEALAARGDTSGVGLVGVGFVIMAIMGCWSCGSSSAEGHSSKSHSMAIAAVLLLAAISTPFFLQPKLIGEAAASAS